MKTILGKLMLLIGIILPLGSCTIVGGSLAPSKNYITRTYDVGNFTGIDFSGVGNIEYTQASAKPSLKIYGPDNYIDKMEVMVKEGIVYISIKKGISLKSSQNIKINISTPNLTNIVLKGVGNISIPKAFQITTLEILNKGVGNIKIAAINGGSLNVNTAGVGNVELVGNVRTASLACDGVGNVNAEDLKAKSVEASCRGVGSITCYATDSITATVKGVGSIKYKGDPAQKDLHRSGIGSIRKD